MSLFDRIFRRPLERRDEDISWRAWTAFGPSGTAVNARMAEHLSTVLACVSAISMAIASLPAWIFRTGAGGREVDHAHPLMQLIRRGPNQHQTWPDFLEWLIASALLRGNGLAEIVTDTRGVVTALQPIPWEHVSVQLLPSGRLAFDVTATTAFGGGSGRPRRLLQAEVSPTRPHR